MLSFLLRSLLSFNRVGGESLLCGRGFSTVILTILSGMGR